MMKHQVTDALVYQYAARLLEGGPLGTIFPTKLSECDFTDAQREIIREARIKKKAMLKESKSQTAQLAKLTASVQQAAPGNGNHQVKPRALTKLKRMLYLQSGRCFFCGELLSEEDATIEHLNPKSRGGSSSEDNEVVCHSSLNQTFGAMDLKRKFEFVLKSAGSFSCPGI